MLLSGDERNGFNIAGKALVRQSHAKLKLKIGEDTQTAYDHLCVDFAGKLHSETAIAGHLDFWVTVECLSNQVHALLRREHQ